MPSDTATLTAAIFPVESRLEPVALRKLELPARLRADAELAVLDITKFFGDTTGGVRTYLAEKAAYVERRPWLRETMILPGPVDAINQSDGVRVYRLRGPTIPTQRPYRFMLATRSIRRLISHERPDVIELGSPYLIPWMVRRIARRLDVPRVWYYHANFPRLMVPHPQSAPLPSRLAVAGAWRYVRTLGERVDMTIAGSEFVARDLEWAGVPRVEVAPLGVDVNHFHPSRREYAEETRQRFGMPGGLLAGYVGRFAREKEIDCVVRGWRRVRRATGARLVLVGDGPAARRLRTIPGADEVVWIPYQSDREEVANIIAALDLYIAPGPMETFGLSAAEALASGTPLLSVDHGAVPELVAKTGAGALYSRGDAEALADAAIALLGRDDLRALGVAARTNCELHYSWDAAFDRIFSLYRALR